ncbi:hypothetical protein CTAM01_16198 [Colletotrichum tamarilloi]|uniref:C2H2-type domain-containing protein n=1 Tax=Colletotrichum tamarilloi TaxID=1209934 RepID=A0ABQ9QJA9_9PEZI|nr:uncharacterized protein CTAM01_16198 [Colletotrichum tamarilloi]KAK1473188.1 hypothetical protein CTAM01_16198 [Colletotrichum tamarilloi]
MSGSEFLDTIFPTNSLSAGVFFCGICSKPFSQEASTFDHQVQWDAFSQIVELPDEVAFGHFPLAEPGLGHITEDLMVGDTDLSPSPEPYRQILSHSMNFGRRVISNTSGIVFPLQFIKEPKPAANGSANMIKQALRSYPEMMLRRSTFPPFIHQYQDKSHLPEPLANCMGIAILYSKRDIFASIQAELIYIIMRVVAGGGSTLVDRDYNTHMLLAYEVSSATEDYEFLMERVAADNF